MAPWRDHADPIFFGQMPLYRAPKIFQLELVDLLRFCKRKPSGSQAEVDPQSGKLAKAALQGRQFLHVEV